MKQIVLFVEGEGDVAAAPVLVKKILTEKKAWDSVILCPQPFKIRGLHDLTGRKEQNWVNKLRAAALKREFGGVLLLLDGDTKFYRGAPFCAKTVARDLAMASKEAGAGAAFSVAVVFACCEYESWLLAGARSLAGRSLPDGRPGIPTGVDFPAGDLEQTRRDAKKWFQERLPHGYNPPIDQKLLTELVDLEEIRSHQLRSFRRLESAISQLVDAFRTGIHVVSPPAD